MSRAVVIALVCALASAVGRASALGDAFSLAGLAAAALLTGLLAVVVLRPRGGRDRGRSRRLVLAAIFLSALIGLSWSRGWISGGRVGEPDRSGLREQELEGWLVGRVSGEPRPARGGVRFLLDVEESSLGLPAGIRTHLWVDSAAGTPRFTSRILAFVELRQPRTRTAPGGFDESRWLHSQDAGLTGRVRAAAWREVGPPPPGLRRTLVDLRHRWSERISARVPGPAGDFLRALVLGERGHVSPEIVDDFRRAGVLHLLALSGQHVALVAVLLMGMARLCGLGVRREAIVSAVGVWLYAALTGLSPSVTRAALGASLHFLGLSLGRRGPGIEVLGWSTALPVLVAPRLGLHVGFQLSCMASAGLIASAALQKRLSARLATRFRERIDLGSGTVSSRLEAVRKGLQSGLALPLATASAQLAVLPLLAGSFGAVSAVGLLSNLLLVPACIVLLSTTLPLVVLDSMVPTPGMIWRAVALLATLALSAGEIFSEFPGARIACTLAPWPAGLAAAAALVAGLGWQWTLRRDRVATGCRVAPYVAAGSCAAIGVWLGLVIVGFSPQLHPRAAILHYWMLDVGQGDCQVLEFVDGRVLVVDVGPSQPGFDAGSKVLAPFLRARGWRRVDRVVITHEDADHAGGWRGLGRELEVAALGSGQETLARLAGEGGLARWTGETTVLARGDTLMRGPGYLVRVLWPPAGATGLPANERSIVLQVQAGVESLILPGDVDSTTERRWADDVRGPVTALKLGHHGAASSTGQDLLGKLDPEIALISCGRKNRFGHPHPGTLRRLRGAGVPSRRTDREGSVHLILGFRRISPGVRPQRLTHRP